MTITAASFTETKLTSNPIDGEESTWCIEGLDVNDDIKSSSTTRASPTDTSKPRSSPLIHITLAKKTIYVDDDVVFWTKLWKTDAEELEIDTNQRMNYHNMNQNVKAKKQLKNPMNRKMVDTMKASFPDIPIEFG